jgi:hypothetical protein
MHKSGEDPNVLVDYPTWKIGMPEIIIDDKYYEVEAEIGFYFEDHSFSHAFGTEKRHSLELTSVDIKKATEHLESGGEKTADLDEEKFFDFVEKEFDKHGNFYHYVVTPEERDDYDY